MQQLIEWVNQEGKRWPAIVSSAILHQRFEWIHPFGDGNGRVGRALALWELYRRQFDTHHLFAVDETLWEHRKQYYAELSRAESGMDPDLTAWIYFMADMIEKTLEKTWKRFMDLASLKPHKAVNLNSGQERLLALLRHGPKRMRDLESELQLTRAGVHYLLKPLIATGLVRRSGTHKSGLYHLISLA
jgi:Fic family protein